MDADKANLALRPSAIALAAHLASFSSHPAANSAQSGNVHKNHPSLDGIRKQYLKHASQFHIMPRQDAKSLVKAMQPTFSVGKYYFATVGEQYLLNLAGYLQYMIGVFREEEGITFVFSEELCSIVEPMSGKKLTGPFAMITLHVDSDLLSVGLLAAVTAALASEKIPCNAFSAYHHDHLLVPYEMKDKAIAALKKLQKSA
jgi:hypothetical protein